MSLLTGPVLAQPQAFDPDAYLAEKGGGAFDPDVYLREKAINDRAAHVGPGESFGRGAAQGATLGFGDEAQGLVQAAGQKMLPEKMGGIDYGKGFMDLYRESRDTARVENESARRAHAKPYLAGEVTGGLAPSALLPTGAASAFAQGAAQGAGYSNADSARGLAGDILVGSGLGLAGHGAGAAVSKAGTALAGVARGGAAKAAGRAGTQAAEESADAIGSLAGKYGGLRQTENNAILSSLDLEARGLLTSANQAKLNALKQSGRVQEALNESVANNLEFLDTRVGEVASAKSALQAAQQGAPQAIAARTAELSTPQIGKDVASFAKSYAEPLVAATLAPAGLKPAAAILFGRTRAGKALMNRIERPGNQIAAFKALETIGGAPNTTPGQFLLRALMRGAPAAAVLEGQ